MRPDFPAPMTHTRWSGVSCPACKHQRKPNFHTLDLQQSACRKWLLKCMEDVASGGRGERAGSIKLASNYCLTLSTFTSHQVTPPVAEQSEVVCFLYCKTIPESFSNIATSKSGIPIFTLVSLSKPFVTYPGSNVDGDCVLALVLLITAGRRWPVATILVCHLEV